MLPDSSEIAHRAQIAIAARPGLSAVKALLAAAQLPIEDLSESHCAHFFYAGAPAAPTGIVGLELCGEFALLRSLAVVPEKRATGTGTALVSHAEQFARAAGVRAIYLLTTTAEKFFAARGYARAAREQAPEAIRATREFAGICPASSAFMTRTLGAEG